jgi:hypothetical protein
MAKKKHYCAATGLGCPNEPEKNNEYCEKHQCKAFSVSYGQCALGSDHQNKHINKQGEEWG